MEDRVKMCFGAALDCLKVGLRVAREGDVARKLHKAHATFAERDERLCLCGKEPREPGRSYGRACIAAQNRKRRQAKKWSVG
jgi:hypothetical protein